MKNMRLKSGIAFAAGLFACGTCFAQPGGMSVPMLPQAIGTHMEQKRTLEQREAMGKKFEPTGLANPKAVWRCASHRSPKCVMV